jgi:ubiquitin C-terminal hydrolase
MPMLNTPPPKKASGLNTPPPKKASGLDAALKAAQEAHALLQMRQARDKAQGRPAQWYLPRPNAQPYCGLKNEGATCYLNSLLQALYAMEDVRREVYAFEYAGELVHGPEELCVPLQLAKLFAFMQLSTCQATSTSALTASFGWSKAENFRQHEVPALRQPLDAR